MSSTCVFSRKLSFQYSKHRQNVANTFYTNLIILFILLYFQMINNLNVVTRPEDNIVHQEPNTDAYIKDECLGSGTLYLSEHSLIWTRSDDKGIQLPYPSVVIHAISRDTSSFAHECLFLMVDQELTGIQESMEDNSDSEHETQTSAGEIRFVPACKSNLDAMYQAMCVCQQLHPDQEDQDSEDNEYYDSVEAAGDGPTDGVVLSAQGMANLARMEQMLVAGNGHSDVAMEEEEDDEGQFEDIE